MADVDLIGASASERDLALLTGLTRHVIRGALASAPRRGKLNGRPTFLLGDVLPLLVAGDTTGTDPESMEPADRKAWYDGEAKRIDLQERMRMLLSYDEVSVMTASAFSAIAQSVRSLPDNLERRFALDAEVVGEIERAIDAALDDLADRLAIAGPSEDASA